MIIRTFAEGMSELFSRELDASTLQNYSFISTLPSIPMCTSATEGSTWWSEQPWRRHHRL